VGGLEEEEKEERENITRGKVIEREREI